MIQTRRIGVLFVAGAIAVGMVTATADARVPKKWANCEAVNDRYPHGVGRFGARDKTAGDPVRNCFDSTLLYKTAIGFNKGLDRDHDGIACEKA